MNNEVNTSVTKILMIEKTLPVALVVGLVAVEPVDVWLDTVEPKK